MKKVIILLTIIVLGFSNSFAQNTYHGDGPDDVLRLVPIASVVVMKAAGVESASSLKRLGVNGVLSLGMTCGYTWALKKLIDKERPDKTDSNAFPSGHCAVAFAGAHILHKEYGHISPWISVGGYAVATLTAADRIRRNRHDWLDCISGATIGVLSTELGYWLGDKITGEKSNLQFALGTEGVTLLVKL